QVLAQALPGLGLEGGGKETAHARTPFDESQRTSSPEPSRRSRIRHSARRSGGSDAATDNQGVRVRKMEQVCEELVRTIGAASDSCVLAWDDGPSPLFFFDTGTTE